MCQSRHRLNLLTIVPIIAIGVMGLFLFSANASARNNCTAVSASDFAVGKPVSQAKVMDLKSCIDQLYVNCLLPPATAATYNWMLSTNKIMTTEVKQGSPIRSEHVYKLQTALTNLASLIGASSLSLQQQQEELPGGASTITFIGGNSTFSDQMSLSPNTWSTWVSTPIKSQHFTEVLNDINQFQCPICNTNGGGCGSNAPACACPIVGAVQQVCTSGTCSCPDGFATGTDTDCSSCGNACASPMTCQSGTCTCPGGQTNCSGTCTTLGTDSNCSSCGNACGGAQTCYNNTCCTSATTTTCDLSTCPSCTAGQGCQITSGCGTTSYTCVADASCSSCHGMPASSSLCPANGIWSSLLKNYGMWVVTPPNASGGTYDLHNKLTSTPEPNPTCDPASAFNIFFPSTPSASPTFINSQATFTRVINIVTATTYYAAFAEDDTGSLSIDGNMLCNGNCPAKDSALTYYPIALAAGSHTVTLTDTNISAKQDNWNTNPGGVGFALLTSATSPGPGNTVSDSNGPIDTAPSDAYLWTSNVTCPFGFTWNCQNSSCDANSQLMNIAPSVDDYVTVYESDASGDLLAAVPGGATPPNGTSFNKAQSQFSINIDPNGVPIYLLAQVTSSVRSGINIALTPTYPGSGINCYYQVLKPGQVVSSTWTACSPSGLPNTSELYWANNGAGTCQECTRNWTVSQPYPNPVYPYQCYNNSTNANEAQCDSSTNTCYDNASPKNVEACTNGTCSEKGCLACQLYSMQQNGTSCTYANQWYSPCGVAGQGCAPTVINCTTSVGANISGFLGNNAECFSLQNTVNPYPASCPTCSVIPPNTNCPGAGTCPSGCTECYTNAPLINNKQIGTGLPDGNTLNLNVLFKYCDGTCTS